jgi:hypothetical protein
MTDDAAVVRGLRSQLDWWEGWCNEVASLLPERYDDDAAQESIILAAVADLADLVERSDMLAKVEALITERAVDGFPEDFRVGYATAMNRVRFALDERQTSEMQP